MAARTRRNFPDFFSMISGIVIALIIWVIVFFVFPPSQPQSAGSTPDPLVHTVSPNVIRDEEELTENPLEVATTISAIMANYTTSFDRSHALYNLLSRADSAEIENFIHEIQATEFNLGDEDWVSSTYPTLFARLVRIDPAQARNIFNSMDAGFQSDAVYRFLSEWATLDLEGAIAYLERDLPDELRYRGSQGIIDANRQLPELHLKALGEEVDNQEYVDYVLNEIEYREDAKNPAAAWQKLSSDPENLTWDNYDRIENIVSAWVKESGLSALSKVLDDVSAHDLRENLVNQSLSLISRNNPQGAFEFVLAMDYDYFDSSLRSVVGVWVKADPMAAWNHIDQTLTGERRERMQQTLIGTWAWDDADSLLNALTQLPVEWQDLARERVIGQITRDSRERDSIERALSILAQIVDETHQRMAASTIISSWVNEDPDAAWNWVSTDPVFELDRQRALATALRSIAVENPERAFELALQQPLDEGEPGLEASVLSTLTYGNIDVALKMLPRVREGVTKTFAYQRIGSSLVSQDRFDEAIEIGRQLSESEQEDYYTTIGSTISMGGSSEKVIERIEKLPSQTAQSKAASSTVIWNHYSNNFSDDQIESIKKFINEEDLKELNTQLENMDDAEPTTVPFFGY